MKRIVIYVLLSVSLQVTGQNVVTYVEDPMVLNQFLMAEEGVATLTPASWYQAFHNSYYKSAFAYGGGVLHRSAAAVALQPQVAYADTIDSIMKRRYKVEFMNFLDRKGSNFYAEGLVFAGSAIANDLLNDTSLHFATAATSVAGLVRADLDLAWRMERERVEQAMGQFRENVEQLQFHGADPETQKAWKEIYQCLEDEISVARGAYMPNAKRHKVYLDVASGAKTWNKYLMDYYFQLDGLAYLERRKNLMKVERKNRKAVAMEALGRWKEASASVKVDHR